MYNKLQYDRNFIWLYQTVYDSPRMFTIQFNGQRNKSDVTMVTPHSYTHLIILYSSGTLQSKGFKSKLPYLIIKS